MKPYKKRPIKNLFERSDGRWSIDITFKKPEGGYKRIRQDFPTKAEANAHLKLLWARKAAKKLGLNPPEEPREDPNFKEFAEHFIETYSSQKRPKTKISHRTSFNNLFSSPLFKDKRLSEITPASIAEYMAIRGGASPVSANRELSFLKLALKKAVEWGKIERNPAMFQKKFEEPAPRIQPLTDKEAKKFLEVARPRLRPLLQVLLTTGIRKSEALALRWEEDGGKNSFVDLKKNRLFIPGSLAKNHKDREVPLSPELSEVFKTLRCRSRSALVFPFKEFRKSFAEAVKKAKIKRRVRVHDLRHTAASRMIEAGVDVVCVCEILGHSDLKITLRYCHSSADKKREAVEKLSRLYALPQTPRRPRTRQNMTKRLAAVPANPSIYAS